MQQLQQALVIGTNINPFKTGRKLNLASPLDATNLLQLFTRSNSLYEALSFQLFSLEALQNTNSQGINLWVLLS